MKLAILACPLLLCATAAIAQDAPGASQPTVDSWSWCVAEAMSPTGKVRYFSEPFEGETSPDIRATFGEYVRRSYAARDSIGEPAVTCRTDASLALNNASLLAGKAAQPRVKDVPTGWRFHFE